MTKETIKIAAKLRKIMEKARSAAEIGNAEEAGAFSAKLQELMTKHQLTMSDVEYAAQEEDDPLGKEYFDPRKHGLPDGSRRVEWMQRLASKVSRAFFCRILVWPGSQALTFVGRNSHREMAVYVYTRLVADVLRLQESEYHVTYRSTRKAGGTVAECQAAVRGFKPAFRNAFVDTVARRLEEQAKAAAAAAADGGNSVALIRLETAENAATRWMKENMSVGRGSGLNGTWSGNQAGRTAGKHHGSRANISADGLRHGSTGPARLGSGK